MRRKPLALTDEQRARMQKNKEEALDRQLLAAVAAAEAAQLAARRA